MGDLLGEDPGLVQADKLYRCLDKPLTHKADFFPESLKLRQRRAGRHFSASRSWFCSTT